MSDNTEALRRMEAENAALRKALTEYGCHYRVDRKSAIRNGWNAAIDAAKKAVLQDGTLLEFRGVLSKRKADREQADWALEVAENARKSAAAAIEALRRK